MGQAVVTGLGMVCSLVVGLAIGWWARAQGFVETVAVPTPVPMPRVEAPMVPANPYRDPKVRERMIEDFTKQAQGRMEAVDPDVIAADVDAILERMG